MTFNEYRDMMKFKFFKVIIYKKEFSRITTLLYFFYFYL